MKTVNLYRYFKGYVKFSAAGGFAERFINLCATQNINLINSSCIDGRFTGITDIRSFGKLRAIARKTGVRISVDSKRGAKFYIKNNIHRVGFVIGAIFYCLFVIIMNMFVWNIDAGGSERYSPEQIIEVAESTGLKYGVCRFFFDERKSAREIYKAFNDDLSWVTVNIIASKCYVDVRDSDITKADDCKIKEPSNLIADFDGVILSDETYSGIKKISKGNAVKEGDLLISGVMDNEHGSAVYYVAEGNFTARHVKYFENLCDNINYMKLSLLSETTTINLFGATVNINSCDVGVKEYKRSECLTFDSFTLPFGFSKIITADAINANINKNQNYLLTADLYTQTIYSELRNTKILSDKIHLSENEDGFVISGEYDCVDFIGINRPIIVENIESK